MGNCLILVFVMVFIIGCQQHSKNGSAPLLEDMNSQVLVANSLFRDISFVNTGGEDLSECAADSLPEGLSIRISYDRSTCILHGRPKTAQPETEHVIVATNNWGSSSAVISISVKNEEPFIMTWKTDNAGYTPSDQLLISTSNDFEYDYTIDWGDGNISTNVTSSIRHTYEQPGVYTVKITGIFPTTEFFIDHDANKLLSIDQWGTNQWRTMRFAFAECSNLEIKAQDAPNLELVTDMEGVFYKASNLNSNLGHWDVSRVLNMRAAFAYASRFNGDISSWDVSNVIDMQYIFSGANSFNQDISSWDVSSVNDMTGMFVGATEFNQDISNWDVSNVTDMSFMFASAFAFNQDLNLWDVSSVENMEGMFFSAKSFNSIISDWDVSSVVNMTGMFSFAVSFNSQISDWDTSSVQSMERMFSDSKSFNQDIGTWMVGSVKNMNSMFSFAESFNQDIGSWDVSSVTSMSYMFSYASNFNNDISGWNTENVEEMAGMFINAVLFDQNIGQWNISNVKSMEGMFVGAKLSPRHYDELLINWSTQNAQNDVVFDAGESQYSNSAVSARTSLVNIYGWEITDAGLADD